MPDDPKDVADALAEPFDPEEVDWKPQSVKGNRAMALAYVDARTVMDRLDAVLGVGNWQTTYRETPDGVVCRLRARIGSEWCEHEDVGSFSEQPDGGDRLKAAFSDALKRVAVHLGVGRYLYRLPRQWCDYDPAKRAFVATPKLPAWALPGRKVKDLGCQRGDTVPAPDPGRKPERAPARQARGVPADGEELHRRLREKDAELAAKGLCPPGALLAHVAQAGCKAGHGADLTRYAGAAIGLATEEAKRFIDTLGKPQKEPAKPATQGARR